MRWIHALWSILLLGIAGCDRPTPASIATSGRQVFVDLGSNEYIDFQQGFDPTEGWSWNSYSHPLFHSRLLRRDARHGLVNDLAVNYKLSRDRRVWTVEIRPNVRFTDGHLLTAEDVAYTFEQAARSGFEPSSLERAIAKSKYVVELHLKKPDVTFIDKFASLGIVPKHAHNANYDRHPIGSGPYKLVQWVEGEQIVIEANPEYYGDKPQIPRIVFLFTQGDASLAAATAGRVQVAKIPYALANRQVPGMHLERIESLSHTAMLLPFSSDEGKKNDRGYAIGNNVTSDRAIRQAIDYAINRQLLVETILWSYGSPVYGFPSGPPWQQSAPAIADDNLNQAKQILAAAGWRDRNGDGTVDKNGIEAEFTLLYMANTPHEQGFALAMAQMLEPIGIEIKPEGSNWEKMQDRTGSDAWLYTLVTRPQDLLSLYRSKNAAGRPNYSNYTNFVVDRILDRGMQAGSETEASYYWQRSRWNGKTGIGTPGDAASVWLAKLDETFLVSDCLDLGRPMRSQHHRGSLLATITEWQWKCK